MIFENPLLHLYIGSFPQVGVNIKQLETTTKQKNT